MTLREISVAFAKKQPKQVDYITEEAPILNIIPFEASTHMMHNVYSEITSVTGAGFTDLDAELPALAVNRILKQAALSTMGGELSVGQDEAKAHGGRDAYFAKQTPVILRESGSTTEYAILYNMIRAAAIANAAKINSGGSNNVNYSILAIKFVPGDTTGLYSPNGFASGVMLPFEWLNGGNLTKVTKGTTSINGYAGQFKNYFGFQIASARNVAGIFNVDRTSATKKLPTEAQIDDLLDLVRASSENTFLLMHPKIKSYLKTFKTQRLTMVAGDKDYNRVLERWDDVRVITSYNFLDATESNVTF